MKVGIMQPYFFPYLGYWQLMNAVDMYVILDDVSYIKGGWINHNFIKCDGGKQSVGIQINGASQNIDINDLTVLHDERWNKKTLRRFESAYRKAPYYADVLPVFEKSLTCPEENLAVFLGHSLREAADYMNIKTPFLYSSEIEKDNTLKAQDRIIEICKRLGADTYINAIGGVSLYNPEDFRNVGMELRFLKMDDGIAYPQGSGDFIPSLSILDIMVHNSRSAISGLLSRYTLISGT